jgi:hypothetical protein
MATGSSGCTASWYSFVIVRSVERGALSKVLRAPCAK